MKETNITRHEEFIKLHQQGYSYQKIGEIYGISRQMVEKIINRDPMEKYRKKYECVQNRAIREWLISHQIDKKDLPIRTWKNIKENNLTPRTIAWVMTFTGMTEKEIRENDIQN